MPKGTCSTHGAIDARKQAGALWCRCGLQAQAVVQEVEAKRPAVDTDGLDPADLEKILTSAKRRATRNDQKGSFDFGNGVVLATRNLALKYLTEEN